jgi:integrase
MKGSTYKRCGCTEVSTGRRLGQRCPKLRQAKHGSWSYVAELPAGPAGTRRQRRCGGFPSRREAQDALDGLRRQIAAGDDVTASLTVGQWLDEWIAGKRRLRPNTARSYRGYIDLYLKPHLGHLPLDRLRVGHVAAMFAAIEAGNSERRRSVGPATMQRIRATLRAALNSAIRQRHLTVNVASHVELPAGQRPPVRVWDLDQLRTFLDAATDDRLVALYRMVAAVGLRRGEVCGLPWSDVDLDTGTLRVSQQLVSVGGRSEIGKPKSAYGVRVVALDADTAAALREHRRRQLEERLEWGEAWTDSGLVFTREDGKPLDPAFVTRHFQALTRGAGLPVIKLHELSHTSASVGLAAGESMKEISDRLGHSSITITADTYTHVSPALARESAERRAALLRTRLDDPDVTGA